MNSLKTVKNHYKQKGGKKLGEGGFGCVITPPILCSSKTSKISKPNLNIVSTKQQKFVSKLITTDLNKIDLEYLNEEKEIYKKIKKIDPEQKNFIYPVNICKLDKHINLDRNDVKRVKFIKSYISSSNNSTQYYTDESGKKKSTSRSKKYCFINQNSKPLNIIFPYGGINLHDILRYKKYRHYKLYYKKFYQIIFYKLLLQIKELHNINIIHADIKLENIICFLPKKINNNWIYNDNLIKIIDFGLSYDVKKHYKNHIYYFAGTEIPIDILIASNIKNNQYSQIKKIINDFRYENEFIEEYTNLFNDDSIKHLINKLHTLIRNNNYELEYRKDLDGFSYKIDIYSLGMTFVFYLGLLNLEIPDKFATLLKKMLEIDPSKRYNIDDCLNDSFFKDIKKLF